MSPKITLDNPDLADHELSALKVKNHANSYSHRYNCAALSVVNRRRSNSNVSFYNNLAAPAAPSRTEIPFPVDMPLAVANSLMFS